MGPRLDRSDWSLTSAEHLRVPVGTGGSRPTAVERKAMST
jgi:hypothetical protein